MSPQDRATLSHAGMVAHLALLGATMNDDPSKNDQPTPDNGQIKPLVATPDADGFVGELSEQAQVALSAIQRQQVDIQNKLAQITLTEHQLVGNFNNLQAQMQRILNAEAVRMGIPKGKPWQVTPEGRARLVS